MDYFIYKVKIWKTGLLDTFDHYVICKDALAVYEYYEKKDLIKNIDVIERIGRIDRLPQDFIDSDKNYYLYEVYYNDPGKKGNDEIFEYVVSEHIKTISQKLKINANWIRLARKISSVIYVKSFQEMDDEIEEMRIG